MYADDDLLPLSGLQHLAYCERQWALVHVEQQWEDNLETVRGEFFHERVDTTGYTTVRDFRAERSVHLVSHALGLYGIADIVEYGIGAKDRQVRPVEYKVGKSKTENWDRIQVAAQTMCLEEMTGYALVEAALFYGKPRRREVVEIDDSLREQVRSMSQRMHELYSSRTVPPASPGAQCRRCSLRDVCLPECDAKSASSYWENNGVTFGDR